MLGHGYWHRRFGGDRAVLERALTINARPHQIIGVMPAGVPFRRRARPHPAAADRPRTADTRLPAPGRGQAEARRHAGAGQRRCRSRAPCLVRQLRSERPGGAHRAGRRRCGPSNRTSSATSAGRSGSDGNNRHRAADGVRERGQPAAGARGRTPAGVCDSRGAGRALDASGAPAAGREPDARACWAARWAWASPTAGCARWWRWGPSNLPRLTRISIDPVVLGFALTISLLSGLLFGLIPILKYARPQARGRARPAVAAAP